MRWTALLAAAVVTSFSLTAIAQDVAPDCPGTPADEVAAKKLAQRWFGKGEELYGEGLYNWAMSALLCSYQLYEHPVTLFNAARAASYAGRKEEALELAKRVVAKDPLGPTADEAKKLIEELRKEIGEAEPAQPEEQPEKPPEEQPEEPPKPMPTADDGPELATAGYVALGLGGAAIVTGAVLQGITGALQKESEETSDPDVFVSKRDTGEKMQKASIASFIVGGVVAAAGLTLVLLDGGDENGAAEVSVVPGLDGVYLLGRF